MPSRRQLLSTGVLSGAAMLIPAPASAARAAAAALAAGRLDGSRIHKYKVRLPIPAAMPTVSADGKGDRYAVAVRQFRQQILPPGMPQTTVWGYGSASHANTFGYPARTIEARADRPVEVTWINGLIDAKGRARPHLLPVDPTLHWANPAGGAGHQDMPAHFTATPPRYTGPVPIVTHVHGAHAAEEADGYPTAWYLPDAKLPRGFAPHGSDFAAMRDTAQEHGPRWKPGQAVFRYDNDQAPGTLWYHDHALGITRLNVYAGPVGFYLIRGGEQDLPEGTLPGPAPGPDDPAGTRHYEIPICIQDRSFNTDGSLYYPDSRSQFHDAFAGPYVPASDIAPIWNPAYLADTIVVNGRTWPQLTVEPRRYRLRLLNGSNSRSLILKIASSATAPRPASAVVPFWQIGSDGGWLREPVKLEQLLLGPGERADVIVDLTGLAEGTELFVINEAPDVPYAAGVLGTDYQAANVATTGQVMKLLVIPLRGKDTSVPPEHLTLPAAPPLPESAASWRVLLDELPSASLTNVNHRVATLGTVAPDRTQTPLRWHDAPTEKPVLGRSETWEILNFTDHSHTVHLHQVQFEVVSRQPFGIPPKPRPAEAWESGRKDTVLAHSGEVTRVKAVFDRPGRYVWHCHMLEHEDNEMMRPILVA
ncbi:multicopper oxidase family protein [Catellatospora methionotrophica]|uniref:multicopper oxidase family protein n=1 Tax=Catellatospora methionotrophica TaxID=121620 RepID=UPI0033D74407